MFLDIMRDVFLSKANDISDITKRVEAVEKTLFIPEDWNITEQEVPFFSRNFSFPIHALPFH